MTQPNTYDRMTRCPHCLAEVLVPDYVTETNRAPLRCLGCKRKFFYRPGEDGSPAQGGPRDHQAALQKARVGWEEGRESQAVGDTPKTGGVSGHGAKAPTTVLPKTKMEPEPPKPSAPAEETADAPVYGVPWKRFRQEMRADRARLGTTRAIESWEGRGLPKHVFMRLVNGKIRRGSAGGPQGSTATPRASQETQESPPGPATPDSLAQPPGPSSPKLAPAQGGTVIHRLGRKQFWPHEEIAQDIATLGRKAAQAKWTGKGMKRDVWYGLVYRLRRSGVIITSAQSQLYQRAGGEAVQEVMRTRFVLGFGPMHSANEGYAVLLEELDELWEEIKGHRSPENLQAMRREAVQVAAMAVAFMVEVCDAKG